MAAEKLSQGHKRSTSGPDGHRVKRPRTSNNDSGSDDSNEFVAGKVKRIFMRNFMCHDAMEVIFNPRVNFIVGANGSGKSAILTALTVGLGARAKITNRGPSIKEFIKKGKSSSMIEITISNEGPMAFKHETYGDAITVIRNITHSTSAYKIKNWRGEIISTKRDELDNIINQLNIQVDNPISVLNQDVSRTFLTSSKPSDKYKLFMKATRLDVIGDNYRRAAEESESTHQNLGKAKLSLLENERELQEIEKKLKTLESLDETRETYSELQKEIQWAHVIQEEKKLLEVEIKIKNQQESVDNLKDLESNKVAKEQEINEEVERIKENMAKQEIESSESASKLNEAKKRLADAKKIHDAKKEKVRHLHDTIRRKESDISTLQEGIKKLEKSSSDVEEKQKAISETAECEQILDEVEATLRTKQTDLMHLEENKRRIEQEHHSIIIDVEQKTNTLTKLRHRLNAIKNQSNDALTVYGANMPRLLKRIEEEFRRGKFRQKPVGPLGAYMKLKDPQWIPAVESHLGFGTLTSFCVDNTQDARVLNVVMSEVYGRESPPQVVISKFFDRMHDVSAGCTNSPRYYNLLDAMEISHPVVANSLIDQREIECILLIPTSEEACEVMAHENRVPRNTKRAITKNADLFFSHPYRTYGGTVTRPKYLQVSTSDAIQHLQEEISVAEDELNVAEQDFKNVREKKQNNAQEYAKVQTKVKSLLQEQKKVKNKIEQLKDKIDSYSDDNNINTFKMEIEELERHVAEKKEEESRFIEEINESKKHLNSLNEECKNQRDLAQNLESRLQPLRDKIKELKDEKKRLHVSNQGAARRMEEAKQVLQKLNSEHQMQQRVVNSKLDSAEKTCPRIETEKSVSEINNKLKELKMVIDSMESQHGTKESLTDEYQEKKAKFEGVREFAIELQRSNDKQISRLKKRRLLYNAMKKELSRCVQESFTNILSLRNYAGTITIDHHKGDLNLEVTMKNDDKRPTNDAKALSGGERSYSTVAFILALWDCTKLPFYFLDEFDVFMDKINRRVVMDILLGHAQSHPESQFSFLTPLDTSHIVADNFITIHRLAAPERS